MHDPLRCITSVWTTSTTRMWCAVDCWQQSKARSYWLREVSPQYSSDQGRSLEQAYHKHRGWKQRQDFFGLRLGGNPDYWWKVVITIVAPIDIIQWPHVEAQSVSNFCHQGHHDLNHHQVVDRPIQPWPCDWPFGSGRFYIGINRL